MKRRAAVILILVVSASAGCGRLTAEQRFSLAKVAALGAAGALNITITDLEQKEKGSDKVAILKAVRDRLNRFNSRVATLDATQKDLIRAAMDEALTPGDDLNFKNPVVKESVDFGFTLLRGALQAFSAFVRAK